jgi:hypothetical protein
MSDVSQPSTLIPIQTTAAIVAGTVQNEAFVLPFNAELLNVTTTGTTVTVTSASTFDVLSGGTSLAAPGTSVYGGTVATLGQAITSTSATVIYVSKSVGAPTIVPNAVIKIGSEEMQVTAVAGAAGAVGVGGGTAQGGVGGQPAITLDPNLYALTVTRGFNASTAAVASINAAVSTVGPRVLVGLATSGTQVAQPSSPFISAGSLIQTKCLTTGTGLAIVCHTFHFAKR